MVKVSFDAPEEDRALMQAHPEVNWSETFRQAIHRRIRMEKIAKALIEEDEDPRVQAVARDIKANMGRRFRDAAGRS